MANDTAPTSKDISIHDQTFTVRAPYQEGQSLSAIEAKVLNQTRAENVANNFRKRIKAALEGVALKEGAEIETFDAVKAAMAAYDETYTFAMPSSGSTKEPLDPVEREALRIARDTIKKALADGGRKLKDIEEDKLEAAILALSEREDVVKEAKRRVSASKKVADETLAGLGI